MIKFLRIVPFIWIGFIPLVSAQQTTEDLEVYEDWRLRKEKDGIQIYTRWVQADDDRKARQMHAVMQVDASLGAVVQALADEEQVPEWLNRVDDYYHFSPSGRSDWYAYAKFDIPWPMKDQDLITRNLLSSNAESGQVHVEIQGVSDYIPEEKDIDRIPHFEGSWDFTPLANGTIQVDYYLFVKSKPVLPRWMIDPIVEYGMWRTFSDFREVAHNNNGKNPASPLGMN